MFDRVRDGISTCGSRFALAAVTTRSASPVSRAMVFLSRGVSLTLDLERAGGAGRFLAICAVS